MYNNMPPFNVWYPPTPPPAGPIDYVSHITQSIQQLEALKKAFKEEKKEDKGKRPDGSVVGMMLFMILMSPITGPIVYYFFQLSANLVHK